MGNMQEKAWEAVIAAMTERVKNNPRGELSAIADEIGATRGTVSRWLSGGLKGRRISYDKMIRIMRVLGLNPAEYFGPQAGLGAPGPAGSDAIASGPRALGPGVSGPQASPHIFDPYGARTAPSLLDSTPLFAPQSFDDPAYYQVPWLEACASMGGGSLELSKEVKSYLSFRRDWLLSKGPVASMVVISVDGDSMSPTIPDGSVVLINEAVTTPVNGKIYLVCYREELFIKRLKVKDNRAVALVSDIDGSELLIRKGEYFNIIGRAIWYGKDL